MLFFKVTINIDNKPTENKLSHAFLRKIHHWNMKAHLLYGSNTVLQRRPFCTPNLCMRVDLPLDKKSVENQDWTAMASGPPGHRATGPPDHRATGPPVLTGNLRWR